MRLSRTDRINKVSAKWSNAIREVNSNIPFRTSRHPIIFYRCVQTLGCSLGRNSKTDYSCSEFYGGFNGAKTGFLSPTVREIFVNKNGKNREI
jgi:hypothetical protein